MFGLPKPVAVSLCIAVIAALPGCEQRNQGPDTGPGNLPRNRGDRTPDLNATTFFAHGHLLERQGEFGRAVDQYRRSLEIRPNFVAARNRLGITLNKLGEHGDASAEFRLVLALQPELAYVQNNLGFSYYLEGKHAAALEALERALRLRPEFPRAHMNMGLVLAKIGRYDEALDHFRQAGTEADACFNLAMIQTEAGDYALAADMFNSALRLNPRLEVARIQLHEVSRLAAAQEAERAAEEQRRLAELEQEQPETPSVVVGPEPDPSTEPADEPPIAALDVTHDQLADATGVRIESDPDPPAADAPAAGSEVPTRVAGAKATTARSAFTGEPFDPNTFDPPADFGAWVAANENWGWADREFSAPQPDDPSATGEPASAPYSPMPARLRSWFDQMIASGRESEAWCELRARVEELWRKGEVSRPAPDR